MFRPNERYDEVAEPDGADPFAEVLVVTGSREQRGVRSQRRGELQADRQTVQTPAARQ